MSNRITEKYFKWNGVSQERISEILEEVGQKEGFLVKEVLFQGMIYGKDKIGSAIYLIAYKGEPVVLKLQILPILEEGADEIDIINSFVRQNASKKVRMPHLLSGEKWSKDRGYGYQITEYIDAPLIFADVLATSEEMKIFLDFYKEYLKSIPAEPWFDYKEYTLDEASTSSRVDNWMRISQDRMRLLFNPNDNPIFNWKENGLPEKVAKYKEILERNQSLISLRFQHKHLTRRDIRVLPDGSYVIFSNLFWAYAPEWYDTTFHIWESLKSIRDEKFTFKEAKEYIEKWLKVYETIPQVNSDCDFEKKFYLNLLERMLGTLLVDLIADDSGLAAEDLKRIFAMHEQLFSWLTEKL